MSYDNRRFTQTSYLKRKELEECLEEEMKKERNKKSYAIYTDMAALLREVNAKAKKESVEPSQSEPKEKSYAIHTDMGNCLKEVKQNENRLVRKRTIWRVHP